MPASLLIFLCTASTCTPSCSHRPMAQINNPLVFKPRSYFFNLIFHITLRWPLTVPSKSVPLPPAQQLAARHAPSSDHCTCVWSSARPLPPLPFKLGQLRKDHQMQHALIHLGAWCPAPNPGRRALNYKSERVLAELEMEEALLVSSCGLRLRLLRCPSCSACPSCAC